MNAHRFNLIYPKIVTDVLIVGCYSSSKYQRMYRIGFVDSKAIRVRLAEDGIISRFASSDGTVPCLVGPKP